MEEFAGVTSVQIIDASSLASLGGGFVYDTGGVMNITRAQSRQFTRPWTPRGLAQE
jgi:hypothetical protein